MKALRYYGRKDIRFEEIEDGTAIGTAIATAANRLKKSQAKSRIVILLTDGANNRGEITPIVAAKAAAELGMKIYTIGVGKQGKIPYPVEYRNPWTGQIVKQVKLIDPNVHRSLALDEQALVNIAAATNGTYYRAHNTKKLEEIYNTIDKLEKTEIKTTSYTTYSEHFFPWLLAGCIVLLLELLLKYTRFRRIP